MRENRRRARAAVQEYRRNQRYDEIEAQIDYWDLAENTVNHLLPFLHTEARALLRIARGLHLPLPQYAATDLLDLEDVVCAECGHPYDEHMELTLRCFFGPYHWRRR